MIKKYKCIQSYPAEPSINTGVTWGKPGYSDYQGKGIANGRPLYFPKSRIEDYPEFWQKQEDWDELLEEAKRKYSIGTKIKSLHTARKGIIKGNPMITTTDVGIKYIQAPAEGFTYVMTLYKEDKWAEIVEEPKEYEILELKKKEESKHPMIQETFVRYDNQYPDMMSSLLNSTEFDIYSIKRLSDAEIFTVGDGIKLDTWYDDNTYLTNIELTDKGVKFRIRQKESISWYNDYQFKEFSKFNITKEPTYTLSEITKCINISNQGWISNGCCILDVRNFENNLKQYDKT